MIETRKKSAVKSFQRLCVRARGHLAVNEPVPAVVDAILLGYIGLLSVDEIWHEESYDALAADVLDNPNAALLIPGSYNAIYELETLRGYARDLRAEM